MNIYIEGFNAFATHYLSTHTDIRLALKIAQVNKDMAALWQTMPLQSDFTNVCWPEGKTLRLYSHGTNQYAPVDYIHGYAGLKVSEIAFIHACARTIYELPLWKEVQKRLPMPIGNLEEVPVLNIANMTSEQRKAANYYDSARLIDKWVTNNKGNFPLIEKLEFGPEFYDKTNLSALPPEFFNLTGLKSLKLQNIIFDQLPPEFTKLTNLKSLSLKLCHLTEFPLLTTLTSLNLEKNEIDSLPEEIFKLSGLKTLNLKNNPIRDLPKNLKAKVHLSK